MFVSEQHTRHLYAGINCQFNIDFIIYFICLSQVFRHGNPISCAHYTTKIKHDVLSLYVELMLGQRRRPQVNISCLLGMITMPTHNVN